MKLDARRACLSGALILAAALAPAAGLVAPAKADTTFPQTGMSVWGPFETYWKAHGGLAQFGMPRTSVFPAKEGYDAQWFERAEFTYNSNNPDPYKVELQLLGNQVTANRHSEAPFVRHPASALAGTQYFDSTGHNLGGKFLAYWQSHGGLPIYGYPISEQFTEKSKSDGKEYLVQYFERNRFEWHPELTGTPYEVQLGLLGSELLDQAGGPLAFANLGAPHSYPASTAAGPIIPPGGVVVVATPDNRDRPPVPDAPALPPTSSTVLFQSDFSVSDLAGWDAVAPYGPAGTKPASWKAFGGRLLQSGVAVDEGSNDDAGLVTKNQQFGSFTFDSYVFPQSGEPLGMIFRYSDKGFYLLELLPGGTGGTGARAVLLRWNGSKAVHVADSTVYAGYKLGAWQRITITANGNSISASSDGQSILSANDSGPASGAVGFYAYADGSAIFDNVRVTAP